MNDTVLLIALSDKGERLLDVAEGIAVCLMRRFRKNIDTERISALLAGEYRRALKAEKSVKAAIDRSRACLMTGCAGGSDDIAFGADAFAREYILGEKSVITPFFTETVTWNEKEIDRKTVVPFEKLYKAAELAFKLEKNRCTGLVVCACGENLLDEAPFMQCIAELAALFRIDVSVHDLWNFKCEYNGRSRVILTDESAAVCTVNALCSQRQFNDCHICSYAENMHIYSPVELCREENGNFAVVRLLNALAAILENELKFKNEAQWLRRGVYLAAQRCIEAEESVYIAAIKDAINDKIRSRGENYANKTE